MKAGQLLLTILVLLFAAPLLRAGNGPESEEDLDRMVRLLFLSPYNSSGQYERALAECERKLAELPRDTQSLYPAYCYRNMVYALRGMNRNDELDKLVDRLLREWKTNLPFLATVSMTDLPSLGFWQDHRFHRAESGFLRRKIFSFQRRDRARILRVMLAPEVWETARNTDPLTRALFCRNVIRHLAMLPHGDSPDIPLQYQEDFPGPEPLPLPPQKTGTGPTDRQRIQSILEIMKKDSETNPEDPRIRQALLDAQSFVDVLVGPKSVPILPSSATPFDKTAWEPLFHKRDAILSTEYGKWAKNLPRFAIREVERIMDDPGFDSPSAAEQAVVAILTGQAKPAAPGLNVFFRDTMPGFTPEDERGKDPALTAFLLEARLAIRENGCALPPANSAVSLLERHIRAKSVLVKEGKASWSDADALAASVCARMETGRTLAPLQRLWPDRAKLSTFALAMLARAFPSDMPEYAELKKMLEDSLKNGLSSRDYGAALLFFTERDPQSRLFIPVLVKSVILGECRDFFSLRALIRVVRSGVRVEPDTTLPFFRYAPPENAAAPHMEIDGDKIILETGSELSFRMIRLEADSFEETPFLQSEDGLLVHGSPILSGKNGREARILGICRLPAGKTVIRIPSSGTLRAEFLPVPLPCE